jgi:hypothetical protein
VRADFLKRRVVLDLLGDLIEQGGEIGVRRHFAFDFVAGVHDRRVILAAEQRSPISVVEHSVSVRAKYMAICRGNAMASVRRFDFMSRKSKLKWLATTS